MRSTRATERAVDHRPRPRTRHRRGRGTPIRKYATRHGASHHRRPTGRRDQPTHREDDAGLGPQAARTVIAKDVVVVLLDEPFTKAERALIRDGLDLQVIAMRRAFQAAMRQTFIDGVEAITGRTVLAFFSDNHVDPDISTEVFALVPA